MKKKRPFKEANYYDSDENFYFTAGYTSNGIPYGTTWEEYEKENMIIKNLLDCPECLEIVCGWIYEEFSDKTEFKYQEIKAYFKKTYYDKAPIALVALKNKKCVGTVSLFEGDLDTRRDLKPWLAALYVDPIYRGQGVGEDLVNSIKDKAVELGYKTLFLRTEHTGDYYRKRNWEFVCKTKDGKGIDTEVFKYRLIKS
jgi:GNAT superfamily N-acetyltransferase